MTLHIFQRPARALIGLVLVTATITSCSGSSGSVSLGTDPLAAIATAMRAAKSGRIAGTTHGPNGTNPTALDGAFDGDLSGKGVAHAQFVSAKGTKLPTELRWINNTLYFTRTPAAVPTTETVSLFTRPAKSRPWRKLVLTRQIIALLPSAFSPPALVAWLQGRKVKVTTHTGETVGSVKATRITTAAPLAVGLWLAATVDLWVDKDARIVRVRITAREGGLQYDVRDYGATVPVAAPPADQIATQSELKTPAPTGPYATVKSGTTAGVTWSVQRAPGTLNTVCWRWQATPPLHQSPLAKPNRPQCQVPPPAHSIDASDYVQFAISSDGGGSYDALVVLMPAGVKHLTFGFVGGTTQSLPPEPLLVWVGPSTPLPAYLGVTLADGTQLDCGAGAVTAVGDLTDPALPGRLEANSAASVWACLPTG
ncbi:MAG TPA: hypothetical protein VGP92_13180 [Acidimicrobiia bacterium]|jgi:hypothetical protein|nr:hypothetical protein [Acidimicrobiia bacterium]